jgi:hypothetical protein
VVSGLSGYECGKPADARAVDCSGIPGFEPAWRFFRHADPTQRAGREVAFEACEFGFGELSTTREVGAGLISDNFHVFRKKE